MPINQKFIPIFFLVIGIVLGFAGGNMLPGKERANIEAVKARLAEFGMAPTQLLEVKQLSGTITAINGNTLIVKLYYPRDPLGDPSFDERVVTIDNNTKITFMVQKDEEVFKEELAVYQNEMSKVKPGTPGDLVNIPPAPQMSDKKDGNLSSFEIGKTVTITTAENVKERKSFTATAIDVTPSSPVVVGGVNTATGVVPPPPLVPIGTRAINFTPPPPPTVGSVSGSVSSPPPPPPPPVAPPSHGSTPVASPPPPPAAPPPAQ
ncbi:MAG: hypothetical protein A3D65_04745 [Candidatus Lloydbacteria bacterium RIFCSPHIGHO2_02_FULL_50_13]|uniref:Uncharacterized protein n=1 Tax=Candidatus Lloydbacteria bacterium RIFCSPHIGHO2_02_FULL_50_13 TaxID=1798661 RepID=A0A1G2DA26_9BACT|nr:MAG: hypothetical protein A3D65_04745 [Candidatus Lloydbacteria bacterium RIFCSPHIGHO2_02_FULL_50_13]